MPGYLVIWTFRSERKDDLYKKLRGGVSSPILVVVLGTWYSRLSFQDSVESLPAMVTMNQKKIVESISVRVPQISPSSSSSLPKVSPKVCCSYSSDCGSAQMLIQNRSNFKRSAAPARFMFYRGGSWHDFQNEVLESLRHGFLEGNPVIEVIIGGANYAFDFLRMVQIDFGSGNQRSISWIDENGKPFFPKVFLDENFMDGVENLRNPRIEIESRIDGHAGKRKGEHPEMDEKDVEQSSSFQNNKQDDKVNSSKRLRLGSMDLDASKWLNAKLLNEKDKAYSVVSNLFLSGMTKIDRGATITAIHQFALSGPVEKARREVFERQSKITKAARGVSNTVLAWYSASPAEVATILTHGFGVTSKGSNVPVDGVGVHLSPVGLPQLSAMLSEADNNGEKHMILCHVILGNVEKVDVGSQQSRPSSADFDTGADDPKNPKWYVVWSTNMNRHILPDCVVSYKSSTRMPGQLEASNCRKHSLSNIFSIMKNQLPSSKLQEVLTLYGTLKAGKLAKEIFINQLRAIAGDEVLMSVLQEIRSSG